MIFKMSEIFIIVMINLSLTTASEENVNLISDMYEFSNRTSVILFHFSSYDNFALKKLIFNIQIFLLKKQFTVSIIKFREVTKELYDKTFNINDNVMVVYLISSEFDLKNFHNITKLMKREKTLKFLLFINIEESPALMMKCMNPNANSLHLKKGLSILVKCYKDPVIREWHSINNEKIITYERAIWKSTSGLISKSKQLVLGDREFLYNKILRAATMMETDSLVSYFNNLCHALENAGNFTIRKVIQETNYGMFDNNRHIWNGAVNLIIKEKIDIALGFFPILPGLLDVVDFSEKILTTEYVIVIKKPEIKFLVSWSAYFQPFAFEVWMSIILLFTTVQIISILIKSKLSIPYFKKSSYADNFLNIYGLFCRQEVTIVTSAVWLRIFYITIIFFSFFIWSIYSSSFVSSLTIYDSNVPFKSLAEFVKVKSHKLIVFNVPSTYYRLKNATNSPLKEAAELLVSEEEMPKSNNEAVEKICKNGMALFTDDIFIPITYHNNISICSMITIQTGEFDSYHLILNKGSPYKAPINHYIRKFHENGIISLQNSKIYKILNDHSNNRYYKKHTPVTVLDIAMILTILSASVIASIIILVVENLNFWLFEKIKIRTIKLTIIYR